MNTFLNTIMETFHKVIYDFVYSATVLSDVLDSFGIATYDLNDKGKYNFICRILYRRESDSFKFWDVVEKVSTP